MRANHLYNQDIIQIGRSDFITSACCNISSHVNVFSSSDDAVHMFSDFKGGTIVFVPPRIPSDFTSNVFHDLFHYVGHSLSPDTNIILISSVICETNERINSHYSLYRATKMLMEEDFVSSFKLLYPRNTITIVRCGMFMPPLAFSKPWAIRVLAALCRPFAGEQEYYFYTDARALESAFIAILEGRAHSMVNAAISTKGLGILRAPSFMKTLLGRVYVRRQPSDQFVTGPHSS